MKRIVECLLEEGIDESMIHRVLDLIEEEYEVVEALPDQIKKVYGKPEWKEEKWHGYTVNGSIKPLNKAAELIGKDSKLSKSKFHAVNTRGGYRPHKDGGISVVLRDMLKPSTGNPIDRVKNEKQYSEYEIKEKARKKHDKKIEKKVESNPEVKKLTKKVSGLKNLASLDPVKSRITSESFEELINNIMYILSESSVGAWSDSARSSAPMRRRKIIRIKDKIGQIDRDIETYGGRYDEFDSDDYDYERAYKLKDKLKKKLETAEQRYKHAVNVSKLPNNPLAYNTNANKFIKHVKSEIPSTEQKLEDTKKEVRKQN